MSKNLKIPKKDRHKFSQPLGRLISGAREETIPKIESIIKEFSQNYSRVQIYLVGDIVSKDFLENSYLKSFIRLCVVDEKTQRSKIKLGFDTFFDEIIEFKNPSGTISSDSFDVLEQIVKSNRKTLLKITEGEEDLLVLPLVVLLPLNKACKILVFYGQPPITDSKQPIPEGIVMVEVNKRIQKLVNRFISMMKQE
ncbi:MAG: DUF359 domain-containing protein [Promethearchaeota archaeon]|nr:MAG: DUF359 domain-containing protein [Candidatus Lokiarchaeota archaeon]